MTPAEIAQALRVASEEAAEGRLTVAAHFARRALSALEQEAARGLRRGPVRLRAVGGPEHISKPRGEG